MWSISSTWRLTITYYLLPGPSLSAWLTMAGFEGGSDNQGHWIGFAFRLQQVIFCVNIAQNKSNFP